MKTHALIASLTAAVAATCFAQGPAETPAEQAAIAANEHAYEAAYEKGDVKALADFFADDAQYTTDDGRNFSGRAEIEAAIKAAFAANKGAKLDIKFDIVRKLAPEVIVGKGSTSVTTKGGETTGALFSAVYVNKGGKWKISQLVETPMPDVAPREHLSELAWLVGKWEDSDKTDNVTIRSEYIWARGGNFLTRNVTVKQGDEIVLEGFQVIGWDPLDESIRSWTFDSNGGYSDARWAREGQRWIARESGVTPDGSRTTSDNTWTKLSNDSFTWESNNRTLDGEPMPSIGRIEIKRVKGE
jgi:uncharacterized protein (TIGR02246 family)